MNTLESKIAIDNRNAQRAPSQLKTIVQVKEGDGEAWKEVTDVTTVSKNGAGFTLPRKCHIGRLVMLVMPMPSELRVYDHHAEVYPIVGLVQYSNPVTIDGVTSYQTGVAFIGKAIPESYKTNPEQCYMISGVADDGLWKITESGSQYKKRKDQRFWISVEVTISLMQGKNKEVSRETTITQNISTSGASFPCSLDASVGDRVKFASKTHDFYAIATVRNIKKNEGGDPIMHLEFVDAAFPMDKILYAHKDAPPIQKSELERFRF